MVGCQPGAERPTDRERKRAREKKRVGEHRFFIQFGTVSLRIEGLFASLGSEIDMALAYSRKENDVGAAKRVVINGFFLGRP